MRTIFFAAAFLTLVCHTARAAEPIDLSEPAEAIRAKVDVPGFAFAVADSEGLTAWGVAGVRSINDQAPIERGDRFHVGSLTKSMTATVVARFVERGELSWDSTIADLDPELAKDAPEAAGSITMRQLLSHRAGFRDDRSAGALLMQMWALDGPMIDRRAKVARAVLNDPNNAAPGSGFTYSNAGYIVAGHLLETLTGEPWETLIERELFEPLGMTTAGQGPPGMDPEDGPQPLGHGGAAGARNPIPPVLGADNPPPLGPAGRVHCSMEDLARYAREHLRGLRGTDGVVTAATFKALHEDPEHDGYALGWGISGEGDERRSAHSGSNTRWYALILVWPGRDLALAIGMNAMPAPDKQGIIFGETLSALEAAGVIEPLAP